MKEDTPAEEIARLKKVYEGYRSGGKSEHLWGRTARADILWNSRLVHFDRLLTRYGLADLRHLKILDVGCGNGHFLARLQALGAEAGNLYGVELLQDRIDAAIRLDPKMHWKVVSPEVLDFPDQTFDIVLQSTVYSSILDNNLMRNMAKEMCRVLRSGGTILSYDVRYPNPLNRNTRPLRRAVLRSLFPGCAIDFHSTTLIPWLAKLFSRFPHLCVLLERIPVLKSHYFAVIRKREYA